MAQLEPGDLPLASLWLPTHAGTLLFFRPERFPDRASVRRFVHGEPFAAWIAGVQQVVIGGVGVPAASGPMPGTVLERASGFIGLHCVRELLEQGYRVRGTLRSPQRAAERPKLGAYSTAARRSAQVGPCRSRRPSRLPHSGRALLGVCPEHQRGRALRRDRHAHPVGTEVHLQFHVPGAEEPLQVVGRIVRRSGEDRNEPNGIGIEFDDLDRQARQRINQLVRSLRTGSTRSA